MNERVGSGSSDVTARIDVMKDATISLLDTLNSNVKVGLSRYAHNRAGSVMYPATALDSTVTNTGNIQVVVQNALDDAVEIVSSGAVDTGINPTDGTITISSDSYSLRLGADSSGADVITGLRFRRVYIPQGVTITSARIQFKAAEGDSSSLNLDISADASDDAPAFASTNNNIGNTTTRPQTASVNWNSVTSWTAGNFYDTPDLSSTLNTVVQRPGWCYGNAISFTFRRQGGTAGSSRRASAYETFNSNNYQSPVASLIVTYNVGSIPSSSNCQQTASRVVASSDDAEEKASNGQMALNETLQLVGNPAQYVGVRFQNLNVPAGATIKSAYLDFKASGADTGATSLTLKGHLNLSTPTFSSTKSNISTRYNTEATTASVTWGGVASTSVGATLTSPDVKLIVQEVVGQAGWASGNPITFLITGSGTRNVASYDSAPANAPLLRVVYSSNTQWKQTARDRLRELVVPMRAEGNTPTADALYEAARYFRGEKIVYGDDRGGTDSTFAIFAQRWSRVSHPGSYSGTTPTIPAGCTVADPDNANCVTEAIPTNAGTYVTPIQYSCQANHIVLLTDGEPNANNSASIIRTMAGVTGSCISNEGSGHDCIRDLAKFLSTVDQSSLDNTNGEIQVVKVHTIGLNLNSTFLQSVATYGNGKYIYATNSAELLSAFDDLFNDVLKNPTSFVSPSLSVNAFNRLYNRDEVYFTLFSPQLTYDWPGNIKKYKLCASGTCNFGEILDANSVAAIDPATSKIKTTAKSYWSGSADGPTVKAGGAGAQIPSYSTRRVYTYTGTSDTATADLTGATHLVTDSNASLTQAMLGAADATERTSIINWMRGQDNMDEDTDSVTNESRWGHADALHSRPLTITYGGTAADPVIKIVVGTNEGGLRMIDATTGQEDWIIYLPEFLSMQKNLRDNVNGTHKIGVDGSPTVQIIDNDKDGIINPDQGDKVRVFVGMRRGGRDIYAFDLTPEAGGPLTTSSSIGAIKPKFLWRIKGGTGDFTYLGQTWSKPLLAKAWVICASTDTTCVHSADPANDSQLKEVLLFAGGYDPNYDGNDTYTFPGGSDSFGNAIYMVDPVSGARMWWAAGTSSGADLVLSDMSYSIPSDLALLDSNGDGAVDRIYVGDTRGQLFRIDLGKKIDPTAASDTLRNGGSAGYRFANIGSSATNQDRRAIFYPPDVAQIRDATYSSTETYDYVTIATGNREDPLDKTTKLLPTPEEAVHNRIYAFRDVNVKEGPPASTPSAITEAVMFDATSNVLANTADTNYATALGNIQSSKGWYIDLKEASSWIGEKSLAKTTIFAGVLYVTTYVPPQASATPTSCTPVEGTAKEFALNLLNGAGTLTGGARSVGVGGGIPSELVVVIRPGGTSALIGTSGGAKQADIAAGLPRFKTTWSQE